MTATVTRLRMRTPGSVRDLVTGARRTPALAAVTTSSRPCHRLPAADDGSWPTCLGVGEDGHLADGAESPHALAARVGTPFLLHDAGRVLAASAVLIMLSAAAIAAVETHTAPSVWRGVWWLVSLLTTVGFTS